MVESLEVEKGDNTSDICQLRSSMDEMKSHLDDTLRLNEQIKLTEADSKTRLNKFEEEQTQLLANVKKCWKQKMIKGNCLSKIYNHHWIK